MLTSRIAAGAVAIAIAGAVAGAAVNDYANGQAAVERAIALHIAERATALLNDRLQAEWCARWPELPLCIRARRNER